MLITSNVKCANYYGLCITHIHEILYDNFNLFSDEDWEDEFSKSGRFLAFFHLFHFTCCLCNYYSILAMLTYTSGT